MEEGLEDEVERQEGERSRKNQVRMHGWDEVKNDSDEALSQCDVRTNECNASKDGAQRAQNYAVFTSVCIVMFMQLVTVRSGLFRLCMKIYAVFRSLCIIKCS